MTANTISIHSDLTKESCPKPFTGNTVQSSKEKKTVGRSVLGPVDENTARIQPFRAAKQNATTEGFFNKQKSTALSKQTTAAQSFKIFDETTEKDAKVVSSSTSSSELHPALIALPSVRVSLVNLSSKEVSLRSAGSPMMLDSSEEERLNIFNIDTDAGIYGLSEYAVEIFEHLREAELLNRPKRNYMRKQQDITAGMRSILVDWLVEVSDEYKLHTETTHLAVNYIDRFLSHMAVLRGKLQLVGAAAMFLAAKFEEIYPPDVGEFVYITDDTYTKKQVLRMEHLILKVLNFDVAVPTSNQFLKRFLKAAEADKRADFLSQYLCELALIDLDFVAHRPSMIAASAVCLASFTVSGKLWDDSMEFYMEYKLEQVAPCIKRLLELFEGAESHPQQALYEKYKDAKYDCVANITPPVDLPFDDVDSKES